MRGGRQSAGVAILQSERDEAIKVQQRAAQLDPWVMYLVVRSDEAVGLDELLLAGAQATMRCAEVYASTATWGESFRAWSERSFRKVTLRAKGSAWSKLDGYDAGVGEVRGVAVVKALPPRLRSECGSLLKSLQVYNPTEPLAPGEPGEVPPWAMRFVINPAARMSVGKQVAQVAHAVLMCAWSSWAADERYRGSFESWKEAGYPGEIVPSSAWERLRAGGDGVVVRDAGLTEVDPGTETVIALPPGYEGAR